MRGQCEQIIQCDNENGPTYCKRNAKYEIRVNGVVVEQVCKQHADKIKLIGTADDVTINEGY